MYSYCILCLKSNEPLTEEHIFPEAAGGGISEYLLCKPCNDKLGHWVDAPYLNQKFIQLARAVHKISGKTGKIPQPFSDTYSIDDSESQLKVKLDPDFTPRVVPQAPKIWITENGEIGLSLSRDVRDKKDIPKIIKTTLLRFFRSEEGMRLGWTAVQIENAIQKNIEGASKIQSKSEQIQTSLDVQWSIDLKALFVEHVKVIYEICCVEFGSSFCTTQSGERLRAFLLAQCVDEPVPWEFIETAKYLNVAPQVPPDFGDFINYLADGNLHTHHIAVVAPNGVFCSMLGMGAIFHAKDLEDFAGTPIVVKVYLNSINGGKVGVFTLGELLVNPNGF